MTYQASLKIITRFFVLSAHMNMLYFWVCGSYCGGDFLHYLKILMSLKCTFLLIECNTVWDPQQKEYVCESPLDKDYNEIRVETADYNSTPSTTLYKFAHCRQLKRCFIAASSYCDLFFNSRKSQNGYNFRTREVGIE